MPSSQAETLLSREPGAAVTGQLQEVATKRQRLTDTAGCEETRVAHQAIRQPLLQKALFEHLGLLAGAHQHAKISEAARVGRSLHVLVRLYHIGPAYHAADLPHYGNALSHFARGRIQPQRLADVPSLAGARAAGRCCVQ